MLSNVYLLSIPTYMIKKYKKSYHSLKQIRKCHGPHFLSMLCQYFKVCSFYQIYQKKKNVFLRIALKCLSEANNLRMINSKSIKLKDSNLNMYTLYHIATQNVTQKIQIIQNINSFDHLKGKKPSMDPLYYITSFMSYLSLLQDTTETFTNSCQSSYLKISYPPMSLIQSQSWFNNTECKLL